MSSAQLLRLALPLVRIHGFTREALANSVLHLQRPHATPLADGAVSTLFGEGDDARRILINAWLDDARARMKDGNAKNPTVKDALTRRLHCNEEILQHLPEAYALLASPTHGFLPLDPMPAISHLAKVADEACWIAGDASTEKSWYARRASLTMIYTAAELHQITSPNTAYAFLDSLLDSSHSAKVALDEANLWGSYFFRSWRGIIKSAGIF